ncbi:iron export ABC transporter permease subunit FetB [Paenibacillus sp. J2TS4]|uniref:ABC transporter permease n=1 Tax=Paenibacillus sp. J2TS4 TaxID=2807194 RepID=UPI001B1E5B63|nr:iron export ABC transporter permease subunit FetB [Paenibacillus sp. J2TS4]GIP31922.1 iron export ABC transporter permease subunit FetB [Paenibacillus sp. J2TS4]
MSSVIDLEWWRLAAAYLFVLILIAIVKAKGISREKEIIIATVRMTVQLVIVGYVLEYVFTNANPFYTVLLVGIMLAFAIYTIQKRIKSELNRAMKNLVALSMSAGVLVSLIYFLLVVIGVSPWYQPTYVIPIAGMIVGNSMTGIALGVNTLMGEMHSRKHLVEAALMLGATPKQACKEIVNRAFDAAMMPTINSMVGMGIVFLPGMMTGQILGGASPIVSIEYQIAIMLGIVGSVSLSVILFVQFGYRTFFNRRNQLEL